MKKLLLLLLIVGFSKSNLYSQLYNKLDSIRLFAFREIIFSRFQDSTQRGTFTDARDGHEYIWLRIGAQIWMVTNLAYLPLMKTKLSQTEKLYYVFGYYGASIKKAKTVGLYYGNGVLYNFVAAQNACPQGWHLPRSEEWETLEEYLGMPLDTILPVTQWNTKLISDKTVSERDSIYSTENIFKMLNFFLGGKLTGEPHGTFRDYNKAAYFWSSKREEIIWKRGDKIIETKPGGNYRVLSNDEWLKGTAQLDDAHSVRCIKN